MGFDSKIQWTDHTFNPWTGCAKVSPGCEHCYAEGWAKRSGIVEWGPGKTRRRTSRINWKNPVRWNRDAATSGKRTFVFCASLADWLDDEVPIEWLADLLDLIRCTPHLTWQLLTKRPQNFRKRITLARHSLIMSEGADASRAVDWLGRWIREDSPPANVWIGATIEDQKRASERIPLLKAIPARIRFMSIEPMLEALVLGRLDGIQWGIIGGESGPGAREFNTEAAWDVLLQLLAEGVAPFVKQLGSRPRTSNVNAMSWPEAVCVVAHHNDPAAAGGFVKLIDGHGGDLSEWPTELRIRRFPNV